MWHLTNEFFLVQLRHEKSFIVSTVDSLSQVNIVKYLVKMTTVPVKMHVQAHAFSQDSSAGRLPLFTHFSLETSPTKPKCFLEQIFFFFFVSLIFVITAMNSCRTQKIWSGRNVTICHHPAQEAARQDLKEIHS